MVMMSHLCGDKIVTPRMCPARQLVVPAQPVQVGVATGDMHTTAGKKRIK